ncbi:MAG: hypothetical protein H7178_01835 [Chitinophagaceae bacterium]|nr:hypothetical protein [Chitinophagaceae bacterium]
MKTKTTKAVMLLMLLISVKCSLAQDVRLTTLLPGGSGLVTGEVLQARNGLLTHYVSGTVESFGTGDQWMGIGKPCPT